MKYILNSTPGLIACFRKACLGIVFFIISAIPVLAQEFQFKPDRFFKRLNSSAIGGTGSSYFVPVPQNEHDWWQEMIGNTNWNTLYKFKSISNVIRVGIDHENATITPNYSYKIELEIKGYNNPLTPTTPSSPPIYLTVVLDYNKDSLQTYKDITAYKIEGQFHAMDVTILAVKNATTGIAIDRPQLAKNFFVETEIAAQRFVLQPKSLYVASQIHANAPNNMLKVSWQHYDPASQSFTCPYMPAYDDYKPVKYELEWTYIDDYKLTNYQTGASSFLFNSGGWTLPYSFKNNATRIQTYENTYTIPVLYEHGAIVFRMRTVRPDPLNYSTLVYSAWNLADTGTLTTSSFQQNNPNPLKCVTSCTHLILNPNTADSTNWQYSINFAEEGKYKHVINYFDGAGHQRQTQTKINSDSAYVIAADKIYDYEGRPAIQTLPIPVQSQSLSYKPNLALQKVTGLPYNAGDFDKGCGTDSIVPLKDVSLASLYYSPLNPDKAGMQQFVPDAKGYPFIETRYSADNTNKVIWQGGAGIDFQRWRNHGTTNVYVRADQYELNRLMGSEAGKNQYYPKQIVTDPNGQSSFSIFNPSGKVVATALIGKSPDSTLMPITPLDNISGIQTVSVNLLANITQDVSAGLRLAEHSFFAEAPGENLLRYEVSIPPYSACGGQYINVKGYYKFKMVNDCGTVAASQSNEVGTSGFTGSSNPQTLSPAAAAAQVTPDKYTITKELYFPDTAMIRLASQFTDAHTGINDCYVYRDSFIRRTVDAEHFPCEPADTIGSCEQRRSQMKSELYPGAKYGGYSKSANGLFASGWVNTIFSMVDQNGNNANFPCDLPPPGSPSCMYLVHHYLNYLPAGPVEPVNPMCCLQKNEQPTTGYWTGETVDTVWVIGRPCNLSPGSWYTGPYTCQNGANTYKYRYQWECLNLPTVTITDANGNPSTVAAATLTPQQLIENFSDILAEALLPLHPEYCKLAFCNDSFDKKLTYIDNYQEAEILGMHRLDSILVKDPLNLSVYPTGAITAWDLSHFDVQGLSPANASLLHRIDTFSLEQAYCGCNSPEAFMYCKNAQHKTELQNMTLLNAELKDKYFLKLRDYYLANRNMRKQRAMDAVGTCAPCSAVRMSLVEPPVFPTLFAGGNNVAIDTAAPDWVEGVIEDALGGSPSSTAPASLVAEYNLAQSSKCKTQVKKIMEGLGNCGMTSGDSTYIANTLIANYCGTGSNGSGITPVNVKSLLTFLGYSIVDLCGPYLSEYGLYDEQKLKDRSQYVPRRAAFYTGLSTFLNRPEVKNALATATASGGTAYSGVSLNTGSNEFELALSQVLNNAGTVNMRGYTKSIVDGGFTGTYPCLVILSGAYTDTLYFARRQLSNPPSTCANTGSPVTFQGANYTALSFSNVRSITEDPTTLSVNGGLIADNLVYASLNGPAPSTVACDNYAIWSRGIPMLKPRDPEALDNCINCVQIKNAVTDYYADVASYGLPDYTNHPLYPQAMSNYLNYKLKKNHTYEEYERLMKGCALSNSIHFVKARADREIIFSTEAAANTFINGLATNIGNVNISYYLMKWDATHYYVWLDLKSIPKNKLRQARDFMFNYTPGLIANNPTFDAGSFLAAIIRTGSCTPPWSTIAPGFTVTPNPIELKNADGVYVPYTYYLVTGSTSTNPELLANMISSVKTYLSDTTITCATNYIREAREVMRSKDYVNPVKQSYLNYVYSLSALSQDDISDRLAPAYLQASAGISAITTANIVTYKDPWSVNVKEDLYYYTTPGTTHTGLSRLNLILDRVKLQLANSLFPTATTTNVSPGALGSGGTSLRAFKMSNGGSWYRLFDQQNKLFNTYIYPSEKMVGDPTSYHMASGTGALTIIPGADSVYRFKVRMEKVINGNTHIVDCYGYTDFSIGAGKMLQNVVLYDHQNNKGLIDTANCERQLLLASVQQGKMLHDIYIDSIKQSHFLAMRQHFPSNASDNLWLTTQKQQYQYTLYYYDKAGNLTRTVPPAGVDTLSPYNLQFVDNERNINGLGFKPLHTKVSRYRYNAFDQLIWQATPDADTTEFFYDVSGKLSFSQNAKQKPARKYSYTIYDEQGRIAETGAVGFTTLEVSLGGGHPLLVTNSETYQMGTIADQVRARPREDVVATFYDNVVVSLQASPGMSAQENLRKRVSCILYAPFLALNQSSESYYAYGTHFSYDALGNVSTLTQDNPYMEYMGQRFKRIDYDYDLLSGKVNMVSYNRGRPDQFYQKYEYDADNRITKAQSSKDGLIWDRDAAYEYYKHGPLAQMQVGDLNVQSVQYAYTIQGWLKAINGDVLRGEDDMGKDGVSGGIYPKDVFTHALGYHKNDYQQIGTTPVTLTDNLGLDQRSLYNGSIVRQTTGVQSVPNLQRSYKYDQLNRLKNAEYASVTNDLNHTVAAMANAAFKNSYVYDADGNIKTLLRKDATGTTIDQLTYNYPNPQKNRLGHVADASANGPGMDLPTGQVAGNYQYDAIGNLIKDQQGEISNIYWNLYGKVSRMEIGSGNNVRIGYDYDGGGNRVRKDVFTEQSGDTLRKSDVYVRDASGNILAVYKGVSKINQGLTIEWFNDNITQAHGGWITPENTGLSPWLNGSFGNNGQFTTELMQTAVDVYPYWTENQSTSLNWAQYMQLSDGIYSQAIQEPIGEYFNPMGKDYSSILVEAFSGGNHSGFRRTFQSLVEDGSKSLKTLQQFSSSAPEMCIEVMQSVGLHTNGLDASQRATSLSGYVLSNGSDNVWYGYIASAQNHDPASFYSKLVQDGSIIENNWLKDNPATADDIRSSITNYAPRVATSEFFRDWLYSRNSNWLNDHTAPDERLHIVYNNDRNTFMTSYLDNVGVTAVNTALSHITQLTIGGYLQQIYEGVLTGTLNPTYDPPDVNTPSPQNLVADTLYLAEHHLYGGSRLGIKKYESNQYRVIYAGATGGSPAVLSDSSLNIRIPWYSLGFEDWIKKDKTTTYTGSTFNLSLDTMREIRRLGYKYYEMTDHLANVLTTVMDRKSGYGDTSGLYKGFYANLASVSDYYPGGFGIRERTKAFDEFEFGYNGQMKSDEVYGKGNLNTAEFWEMDTRLVRRWNLDPVDQINVSNYAVFLNNPITMNDVLGNTAGDPGDYYTKQGKYAGKDELEDGKVYVTSKENYIFNTAVVKGLFGQEDFNGLRKSSTELGIGNNAFKRMANVIKQEGTSTDPNEYLYIAHTNNNEANRRSTKEHPMTMSSLLMSDYSSVKDKSPLSEKDGSATANFARAGLIDVLQGNPDPTNNATLWDGTDFLAWGLNSPNGTPHNKLEEYKSITIGGQLYSSFLKGNTDKWGKNVKYGDTRYPLPATLFSDKRNWSGGNFHYNTGVKTSFGLRATVSAGQSIFWRREK